ncbi:hypothetical protein MVEN_01824200 [Mycena venus]|uniref:F-box domain-containing protein n=1 Tax=Mycena venus TaxID=2733690 RepID=A0A8H7CND3_9AGAR|nr:hypothetical protein MVEN_01824200 [Mycena venus]
MSQVPQELIDAILELVPEKSLLACALTATSFVKTSQRRIFRWMSIVKIPAYERIATILTKSPHLGQYVHFLALHIAAIPADWAPLKNILSTMTELERLTITGDANAPARNQLGLNPCLIELLSVPSLLCVGLDDLSDVPASVVTKALETFEEVSLSRLTIDAGDVGEGSTESTPPTESDFLWHLNVTMDAWESIIPFLFQPRKMGYLKYLSRLSLTIMPIPESLRGAFTATLTACAPSLERLELEFSAAFALPTLPVLWHLELWVHSDTAVDVHPDTFPTAISTGLAAAPHLGILTVAVRERPVGRHLFNWGILTLIHSDAWVALEDQFLEAHNRRPASPSVPVGESRGEPEDNAPPDDQDEDEAQFDALEEVHFSLRYFQHEPDRYSAFMADLRAKLPRTRAAGLLTFSHHSTFRHPMDRFSREYD